MMNYNLLLWFRSLLLLALSSCALAAAFTIVSPVRTPSSTTFTAARSSFRAKALPLRPSSAVSRRLVRRKTSSISTKMPSTTALQAVGLLWDRLEIEEDDEPHWYLLNCVATNELILLQQCRHACKDMSPQDVVKFIVPTERKMTRSHGPNKMVTETKVKYQGYVFAKLRLCAHVYEALQGLDLCRSWMGTVNHKGYRKLPPAPLALSETEIANFGLEDYQEDEENANDDEYGEDKPDEDNVIVDEAKESADESDENASKSKKSTKDNSSKHALKVYLGLKVDDMIKVTGKGKFFNEDGIIRRLKDGKLLVRFYTYGSLWEEWLDPSEVRKLDNMEILRGLSGPSQPVTQRDFDDPSNNSGDGGRDRGGYGQERNGNSDRFGGAFGGGSPQLQQRNRRQDRTEQRFRNTRNRNDSDQQDNRNDSNWNWYKDNQPQPQQQEQQQRQQWDRSPAPRQQQDDNNNSGSPWGRPPAPPRRQEYGGRQQQQQQWDRPPPRRQQDRNDNRGSSDNRRANQSTDKAIRGEDDWSAFVSSPSTSSRRSTGGGASRGSGGGGGEDDFFQSLLNDLSDDLQKHQAASQRSSSQQEPQQQQQQRQQRQRQTSSGGTLSSSSSDSTSVEDDFFASLLSEVNEKENQRPSPPVPTPPAGRPAPAAKQASRSSSEEDDFFASLLSQVSGDVAKASSSSSPAAAATPKTTRSSVSKNDKEKYNADYADDLFAELTADIPPQKQPKKGREDSFFDDLQADLWSESTKTDSTIATASPPKSRAKAASAMSKKQESPVTVSAAAAAPPPPRNSSSSSSDDLNKRTVPALKELLREKGLKVSGNKAELVERLQNS